PPNLLQGKSLPTPSTELTKRTREEKSSAKLSKSPPKKSKVGAELNSTQASSSCRVIGENRTPVEIAFETLSVFKPKLPPPDCHFSAFNYFCRRFDTPVNNREAIDSRAQAEREAYRHLDDNLATFIICFMPPYHSEMSPAAREFAELCSVHLRNQLRRDPWLLPEQIEALVAKFFNILTEYYTSRVIRPAADHRHHS
uniref:Uncharacterized protein n=1 Tax=Romanomermis culicivorax TaxID=13658 RepID=A0A915JS46_ROMCU